MAATFGPRTPNSAPCFRSSFPSAGPMPRTLRNASYAPLNPMTPQTYAKNTMQTTQKTVLIGEDEIEVRGYLEMALKCLGYSVESAQDGDEVLSCLQSSRSEICAVLLDLTMPNRDGFDTLREIRRIKPNLPVIVISGDTSTLSGVGAMKTAATDYLPKPVLREQLREALARAMELPGRPAPVQRGTVPAGKTAFVSGNPRMKQIHALVTQI